MIAADLRSVTCLLYLRRSWSLKPLKARLRKYPFLLPKSRLRTLVTGPRKRWRQFVVPGIELFGKEGTTEAMGFKEDSYSSSNSGAMGYVDKHL